jgi:GTP-binding protein LepA
MLKNLYQGTIITKADYVGNEEFMYRKTWQITNQTYLTTERVELTFDMPLAVV